MAANPTTRIRNIAIVGATGQLGKYITAELLKNPNFTVTALTRTPDTSSFPSNLHAIPVDYSDPSTLTAALKGQDALIITLAVTAPPQTRIPNSSAPPPKQASHGFYPTSLEVTPTTPFPTRRIRDRRSAQIESSSRTWVFPRGSVLYPASGTSTR